MHHVGELLSSDVAWTAERVPRWRRVVHWAPTGAWGLVVLALSLDGPAMTTSLSGPSPTNPVMPSESDEMLGTVTAWGRGVGLPAAFPGKQLVSVYADRATICPGLSPITLQLGDLTLESARRLGPYWRRRKADDARWELHLTGLNMDLTMVGPWLLLAHLGTLAGWPEPA